MKRQVSRLGLTGLIILAASGGTALAQGSDGVVGADELRRSFIGKNITHHVSSEEKWQFFYKPDGSYDSHNGRIADGGRYTIRPDGSLCWTRRANMTGCFQYYSAKGKLRVRAQGGDIGPVSIGK